MNRLILLLLILLLINTVYFISILIESLAAIKILLFFDIFLTFVSFYIFRKVLLLLLFNFFIFAINFYLTLYLIFGYRISEVYYESYYNPKNMGIFLFSILLFKASLVTFINIRGDYIPLREKIFKIRNRGFYYVVFVLIFLLSIFGFDGEIVFLSESPYMSYISNLEKNSGIVEYMIILLIILWLLEDSKVKKYMTKFLFVFILFKLFLLGFRVQFLMYLLLFYIFYLDGKVKTWTFVFYTLIGYIFANFFGVLKEIGIKDVSTIFNRIDYLFTGSSNEFILSHFTGVITSSMVIIGNLTYEDRFMSMIGTFINAILPNSIVNSFIPQVNIPKYVFLYKDKLPGGLFFPTEFYLKFGMLGPIFLGYFLSLIFNKTLSSMYNAKQFTYLYSILVFSEMPRWLFYTQVDYLFRQAFYMFFIYLLLVNSKINGKTIRVGEELYARDNDN